MIRVLHFAGTLVKSGGIENFIMNIYRLIDRNNIQFDFCCPEINCDGTFQSEIESMGGRVYKLESNKYLPFLNRKKVKDFLTEHKEIKIVHVHMAILTDLSYLEGAKDAGVPVRIVHSHNNYYTSSKVYVRLLHHINKLRLKKYASHYLGCSEQAIKFLFPRGVWDDSKVINNGIDVSKYVYNEEERRRVRKELNIDNMFVVGNIARITPQKNQLFLIQIFAEILKIKKECVLLLVGNTTNQKLYFNSVLSEIEKYDLKDNIKILGVREDTVELYNAMDVYVHPSLFEGLGISLVEAQCTGLPCIISADTIPDEVKIIDDLECVSLAENPKYWAKVILKHLSSDRIRKTESHLVCEKGFDANSAVDNLIKIYTGQQSL